MREDGDGKAHVVQAVGHDDARSAGGGEDRRAPTAHALFCAQNLPDPDDVVDVLHRDDAVLREDGRPDAIVPGQGCRMALGRLTGRRRTPGLQHGDGDVALPSLADQPEEARAVLEALQIEHQEADFGVLKHVVRTLHRIEVRLVAGGGHVAKPHPVLQPHPEGGEPERPALRHERHVSRQGPRHLVKGP